jgi:hypothetical protein
VSCIRRSGGSLIELAAWFVRAVMTSLWGLWTFPCVAVLAAPMVGEAARVVGQRWCSPLRGHVQWARGVPGLHSGGRDSMASARLGRILDTVC